jgi:hypothetical protein
LIGKSIPLPSLTKQLFSSESIPEWESHIDAEGELFYIEFSSNLQVPTPTTDTACRQPSAEDRQEVLKKKKKKKSKKGPIFLTDKKEENKDELENFSFFPLSFIQTFL